MNLTRQQTALIEQGRSLEFWKLMNHYLPEEDTECGDMYGNIDSEYQYLEDLIDSEPTVTGINENGESYTLTPFPNRKPPVTRPQFPF